VIIFQGYAEVLAEIHVFKGSPPATTLGEIPHRITSLSLLYYRSISSSSLY